MKRIISIFLILVLATTALAACSSDSDTSTTELYYNYDMSKYVSLGEYSKKVDRKSDDFKNAKLSFYNETFGTDLAYETEEGYIELGDTANINYKGLKDGVAFEGGTSSNYDLVIGSGTFIPGFEEGLVGKKIGDTVNLNLTFPKEYQSVELAGADVVFVVTINFATKLADPTETDALKYGFDSLSDYEKQADEFAIGVCLFTNISESAKIKAYPDKESELLLDSAINDYKTYFTSQGTNIDDALKYQGTDLATFREYVLENEIKPYMDTYLVAYYILQLKESDLTEEDVESKRKELDDKYEVTLESLGYDAIEIQHTAALSNVIEVLLPDAEVVN